MVTDYSFDAARFFLGKNCKRNHDHERSGCALRYVSSKECVECVKERTRAMTADGRSAAATRRHYLRNGRASRGKSNPSAEKVPYGVLGAERRQAAESRRAARAEQRAKTDALRQQRKAQRETPEWREQQRAKRLSRYQLNEDLRIYDREKSKRRKALMKARHVVRVRARDIRARFATFGNCCAYCGESGDMHMDHFVPLARGGTHTLGNLLPACSRCNLSKRDHDAEAWYKQQPYFSRSRWKKLREVLGIKKGPATQLTLL
jgi:5-methylcytosine-specific restriction endonuclease McrA